MLETVETDRKCTWRCRDRELSFRHTPLVMGILNVTPDSFFDGGRHTDIETALAHARLMADSGADIIDVGGESTRPGAPSVSPDEETARVIPVIERLTRELDVPTSVDTRRAAVARAALEAGAVAVNDVSALTYDTETVEVAARFGAGIVLMHMQGTPETMQKAPHYENVITEVRDYLAERVATAVAHGIAKQQLAVDPGIGFGKSVTHNLEIVAQLDAFRAIDCPVLIGLSRKSFLGHVTGREVDDRLAATLAALAYAIAHGANILRVHDVREARDCVSVIHRLQAAREDRFEP